MKCPTTLAKNIKLIEAIGLLIAFCAWWLDWGVVRHWNGGISDLRSSVESIQFAYALSHTSKVVQFESAVTRATLANSASPDNALQNYANAWHSAEVRSKWLGRALNDLALMENLATVIESTGEEFVIKYTRSRIRDAKEKVLEIRNRIGSSLEMNTAIPMPGTLRGRDAGAIDAEIQQIHAHVRDALNEALSVLSRTKGSRETVYRTFFAIGAAIFLIAKLFGWWDDCTKQSDKKEPLTA